MAADTSITPAATGMGGFLAKTSGTITVTAPDGSSGSSISTITIVDAVPVTEGVFTPIPLVFPQSGCTITLAGGASGTVFI